MTFLLDVNVLIALIDPTHVSHDAAHDWFAREGRQSWATCPITENGTIRIASHPSYRNAATSPAAVADIIRSLARDPGHVFWPDDISLRDSRYFDLERMLTHRQVTDSYLLALAAAQGGKLATLDRRLSASAVLGGAKALSIIPA